MSLIHDAILGFRPPLSTRVRRQGQKGAVGAVVTLLAALLAGCSATSVPGPTSGASATMTSTTTSPVASPSPSASSPRPGSTSTSAVATTGTSAPVGTVVPFSTVGAGSAAGKRFGLVSSAGSDPFGKAASDSIIAQVDAAGADLVQCDPGEDETLVLDCARRMAIQKVDGWIVLQPGELNQALCAAGPTGVPLIAVAAASVSCQTASVGADDRLAGFLVGAALGQVSRARSHCVPAAVVIIGNRQTETISSRRVDGIRAGYTSVCPGPVTGERLVDAGTQDLAYAEFTKALTALPEHGEVLVAAVNDGSALGAAAAIPAGRVGHVSLAGIGGDQRARCEILANSDWIGDAALFPDRYGEVAVPALLDALQGRAVPPTMYVPTLFVTAATMGRYYDVTECPRS